MQRSGAPLTLQVGEVLKSKIIGGLYRPASRLPSTRALAAELGVSRTTVTIAYEQLLAEGYLETRPGSGTFVARGFRMPPAPEHCAGPAAMATRLSRYGARALALMPAMAPGVPRIDFRYGAVSAADFPVEAWRRALARPALPRSGRLQYGDPRGTPALRAALQAYLWRGRGLRCDAGQIVVVNGSQQALDLCCRLLVDPGDRIAIEDPCYSIARDIFTAAGAIPAPVAVDQEGMRTGQMPDGVRLAYVTPSHQFPLGSVMSVGRRQALLAWAGRTGGHVIEDDYDSEFRFDGRPIEAMRTLDTAGRVIYVGTVSKTLSPGVRLGYLVAPPALADGFAAVKRLADRHTPELLQHALTALIEDGVYERHVRRLRRRNADRRAALLAAIEMHLGDRVVVAGEAAGLHLVIWFKDFGHADEAALQHAALDSGIGIYPIGPHCQSRAAFPQAGVILGYASLDEAQIELGIRRLGAVLSALAKAISFQAASPGTRFCVLRP